MNSKLRHFGLALALTCALGCSARRKAQTESAKAPQLSPAEMEQAWMKAATPNENHKILQSLVGNWKAETKFWQAPNTQPEVTQGISRSRTVFDGRFVEQEFNGTWNGQPFSGLGVWGYDNVSQKFQSSWYDSMNTQMMMSSGTFDPQRNAFVLEGKTACPLTGDMKTLKSVTTLLDKDHHKFEMYDIAPDGSEFKALEISYTRADPLKAGKKTKAVAKK